MKYTNRTNKNPRFEIIMEYFLGAAESKLKTSGGYACSNLIRPINESDL